MASGGFYALLTTYWDRPYFRFGFHYLIKSVQQLADSSDCQPGLKAGLWALCEAAGCQLAPRHKRQCWLDGTWVCVDGVKHSLSSWCWMIDLFSNQMLLRVSEKNKGKSDKFFNRMDILFRLESVDQFTLSLWTKGSLRNYLVCWEIPINIIQNCESCVMYVNIIFQALNTQFVVLCWQVISVPYDERPLPALQRKDQPVEATQSPAEQPPPQPDTQRTLPSAELSREPEPLTDKAQREAGLPIEVYGESLVRKKGDMARLSYLRLLLSPELLFVHLYFEKNFLVTLHDILYIIALI